MMKFFDAAELFADCWYLYRRYYGQSMTEEQYDSFTSETEILYKKYRNDNFAKDMMLAVANEIERMEQVRCHTKEE